MVESPLMPFQDGDYFLVAKWVKVTVYLSYGVKIGGLNRYSHFIGKRVYLSDISSSRHRRCHYDASGFLRLTKLNSGYNCRTRGDTVIYNNHNAVFYFGQSLALAESQYTASYFIELVLNNSPHRLTINLVGI